MSDEISIEDLATQMVEASIGELEDMETNPVWVRLQTLDRETVEDLVVELARRLADDPRHHSSPSGS